MSYKQQILVTNNTRHFQSAIGQCIFKWSSGASTSGTSGRPHTSSGTGTGTSSGNATPHGSGVKPKAKVKVEEPGKNFLFYSNY